MSLMDYETADSTDVSGEWVQPEPGIYHLAVNSVELEPTSKTGELIPAIRLNLEILAGTTPGQEKRKFRHDFRHPLPSHRDGGKFAAQMLSRLAYVCGIGVVGKKLGELEWESLETAHFIAEVHHREWESDEGEARSTAEISGMRFWHVGSPEVASVPKDSEVLEMVDMGDDPLSANGGQPKAPAPPKAAPKAKPAARATKQAAATPAPAKSDPYADL